MTDWSAEQRSNANVIISTGLGMGMSWRDIQIGLMTAMQESGLRNLNYGDRDSLGLFQQRPSQGWGTAAQVTNPQYAATKFFSALKGVGNRQNMSLSAAAQAVQRSAYPDAYAKWTDAAQSLVSDARGSGVKILPSAMAQSSDGDPYAVDDSAGIDDQYDDQGNPIEGQEASPPEGHGIQAAAAATPGLSASTANTTTAAIVGQAGQAVPATESTPTIDTSSLGQSKMTQFTSPDDYASTAGTGLLPPPGYGNGTDQSGNAIVDYAKQFLGTPYVWGGTNLKTGVDCSGLVQQVFAHFGTHLPRISYQQADSGTRISLKDLQPGDLVAWDNSSRNNGADHIAIYAGNGKIIEAPRPGRSVQISNLYDTGQAWGVRLGKK